MEAKDNIRVSNRSIVRHQVDIEKSPPRHDIVQTINASGHVQELDRKFGLWSICLVAIAVDNAWGAGSGALVRICIPCPPARCQLAF